MAQYSTGWSRTSLYRVEIPQAQEKEGNPFMESHSGYLFVNYLGFIIACQAVWYPYD